MRSPPPPSAPSPFPVFPPHSPFLRRVSSPKNSPGGGNAGRFCFQREYTVPVPVPVPSHRSTSAAAAAAAMEVPVSDFTDCCRCCYPSAASTSASSSASGNNNNSINKKHSRSPSCAASVLATLGICCLVLGYTILGAFTFMALEGGAFEHDATRTSAVAASKTPPAPPAPLGMGELRTQTVDRLWSITENLNILYRENWTRLAAEEVMEFQEALFRALRSGSSHLGASYELGHHYWPTTTATRAHTHRWSFTSSFLYSLTLITTIGYGSVAPRTTWGKLVTIVYAVIGIPLMLLYLSATGDLLARSFRRLYSKFCNAGVSARSARSVPPKKPVPSGITSIAQCCCSTGRMGSQQNVRVPVSLCLIIVMAYICSGALLFQRLENWSLLEGSYFCFTSLGTIGFGDLIPGQHSEHVSLCVCAAYILTGMALVAMCFTLIQDQVLSLLRLATVSGCETHLLDMRLHHHHRLPHVGGTGNNLPNKPGQDENHLSLDIT